MPAMFFPIATCIPCKSESGIHRDSDVCSSSVTSTRHLLTNTATMAGSMQYAVVLASASKATSNIPTLHTFGRGHTIIDEPEKSADPALLNERGKSTNIEYNTQVTCNCHIMRCKRCSLLSEVARPSFFCSSVLRRCSFASAAVAAKRSKDDKRFSARRFGGIDLDLGAERDGSSAELTALDKKSFARENNGCMNVPAVRPLIL